MFTMDYASLFTPFRRRPPSEDRGGVFSLGSKRGCRPRRRPLDGSVDGVGAGSVAGGGATGEVDTGGVVTGIVATGVAGVGVVGGVDP